MRSFFRFHLLTAILLSFVAGGLIKLNLRTAQSIQDDYSWALVGHAYGWPFIAVTEDVSVTWMTYHTNAGFNNPAGIPPSPAYQFQDFIPSPPYPGKVYHWKFIAADIAVALVLLAALALVTEHLLRRRHSKHALA